MVTCARLTMFELEAAMPFLRSIEMLLQVLLMVESYLALFAFVISFE
jgi:hypothetical protein